MGEQCGGRGVDDLAMAVLIPRTVEAKMTSPVVRELCLVINKVGKRGRFYGEKEGLTSINQYF